MTPVLALGAWLALSVTFLGGWIVGHGFGWRRGYDEGYRLGFMDCASRRKIGHRSL